MKIFRTHIIRFAGTCLLMTGILLYFLNPAEDKSQHETFAYWLQSSLKSQDDSDLLKKIDELSALDAELDAVIKMASALVHQHAKDFDLTSGKNTDSEHETFRLLLTEWNAFQNTTGGMGKAVIIKNTKPSSVLPADALAFSGKYFHKQHQIAQLPESDFIHELPVLPHYQISPLSGGTAIGAP